MPSISPPIRRGAHRLRFSWLLVTLALVVTSIPNYVSARSAEPPEIARIHQRGKLIVAVLGKENPPFFYHDKSGKWTGKDVELARDLAKVLKVDLEIDSRAGKFDEVVKEVVDLRADIAISKLSATLKRAQIVRFSEPYVGMRQGLLVNRLGLAAIAHGRKTVQVIKGLTAAEKIGVVGGGSYVGFAHQNFPKATVVEYPSWPEVIAAVSKGEILAAYRDELEVKKIIRDKPDMSLTLQVVVMTDTADPIAMALPYDSGTLLAFVNQYLAQNKILYSADSLLDEFPDLSKNGAPPAAASSTAPAPSTPASPSGSSGGAPAPATAAASPASR